MIEPLLNTVFNENNPYIGKIHCALTILHILNNGINEGFITIDSQEFFHLITFIPSMLEFQNSEINQFVLTLIYSTLSLPEIDSTQLQAALFEILLQDNINDFLSEFVEDESPLSDITNAILEIISSKNSS